MDREDIMAAVEVALGDTISSDGGAPQSVADRKVQRQAELLRRTLRELPPYATVEEILEGLDE